MKKLFLMLAGVVLLVGAVGGYGALRVYERTAEPYRGYRDQEVFVDIASGTSTATSSPSSRSATSRRVPSTTRRLRARSTSPKMGHIYDVGVGH